MGQDLTTQIIGGLHDVRLALEKDAENVTELWTDRKRKDRRMVELVNLAAKRGLGANQVDKAQLDELAAGLRHQGVLARYRSNRPGREGGLESLVAGLDHEALILVLDGVQDPHNLGACLRTSDGAGVDAVVVPADHACTITPVVSRVASGAAHSVPFFSVSNLSRTLESLKQLGIWVIGASDDAEQDLWHTDLAGPVALVLGAEGSGLRALTRRHCDLVAAIPMAGSVESLNVSVAAGIMLYEARRQRTRDS